MVYRLFGIFLLVLGACGDAETVTVDEQPNDPFDVSNESDAGLDTSVDPDTTTAPTLCGCFELDGTYCSATAKALASEAECELPSLDEGLWNCTDGQWALETTCDAGCQAGETAGNDVCALPVCECFVQVAWCGSGAQKHAAGFDEPCRVPLLPEHDGDILACDNGEWVVKEACAQGCFEAPTGTPDYCVGTRTPQNPGWEDCPERPLLKTGLHPEASNRLRCAGVGASEISQTVGYATASAGYHAPDGTVDGKPYTAAVDIRIGSMNEAQIKARLNSLANHGFAAWYRKPGSDGWPSSGAPHIHAIFAGVKMKAELRGQVRDWLNGRNGLSSHSTYRFWTPTAAMKRIIELLFERNYTP